MPESILICRTNPIAPDPRVEKIAISLVSAGYTVIVLGWDRSGELPVEDRQNGFQIWRLPIKAGFGKGMGNLPHLIRWEMGLAAWLARYHKNFDVIHACDFDTVLPALLAKLFWHKKVVYDIFDFYADHLRNTPNLIKNLIRSIDRYAINSADAVIIVDDCRKQQIFGTHPRRLEIVYNSPYDIFERTEEPSINDHGSTFRLAYIGLLQVERGLFEILDVMIRHPDWSLDLAGFGGDEQAVLEIINNVPNVTWHGRIPYEQALQLSYAADVLLATYDPSIPNHRYASPNKVFEAMMLGRPIIVARYTNMDEIITRTDCGIVVEYGSISELEAAMQKLASSPELRSRFGKNGRLAYKNSYNWNVMQDRLLRLYRQL